MVNDTHNLSRNGVLKLNKFIFLYCVLFTARTLINFILQCTYISVKSSPDDIKTFDHDKNATLLRIEDLMVKFGQVYRAAGTPGLFYYSAYLSALIFYYFPKIISNATVFDYINDNSLISYLTGPILENRRISQRIDSCLNQIINSNINFMRSINEQGILRTFYKDIQGNQNNKPYGIDLLEKIYHPQEAVPETLLPNRGVNLRRKAKTISAAGDKLLLNYKNSLAYEKQKFNYDRRIAKSTLENSLKQQLSYLTTLGAYKWKIWPPNRRPIWARNIKQSWLKLYHTMTICCWFVGQLSLTYANRSSSELLIGNSGDRDVKSLTIFDRLLYTETHIFVFFLTDWVATPVTVLIVCVLDQLKYLSSLKPKISKIYERTRRLERDYFGHKNFKLNEQLRKDLQLECDKEAIELYISYHICREDTHSTIEVAQQVMNQCLTNVAVSLIPMLVFYKEIPEEIFSGFQIILLTFMLTLNGSFCICASLHADCSKVAALAWNFVAFAEGHNCDMYISSRQNYSILKKALDTSMDSFVSGDIGTYGPNEIEVDCEYYSGSSINPHTVLLWRRLVKNHEFLRDKLVCKLYGKFKIDYNGILKFNFWFISFVLLSIAKTGNNDQFAMFSRRF